MMPKKPKIENRHYVYQVTNKLNGMIYIGKRSCKCPIDEDTYFGSGTRLKYAIKKYGKENFTKTIIDVCDSLEEAYELEALIVDEDFLKRPDTYNLSGGGIGPSCHSDEVKQKISLNHAKPMTGKLGELNPRFGKRHTAETITKMSIAHKGHTHTQETKEKLSILAKSRTGELSSMFGKQHSDETKAKISAANIGKKPSDETRKKLSILSKGRKHSVETRKKMSASRLLIAMKLKSV